MMYIDLIVLLVIVSTVSIAVDRRLRQRKKEPLA